MVDVLVVDDSALVRGIVIKSLSLSGIELGTAYQAGNGAEGLELLRKHRVQMVFTDLNMPIMDGIGLIQEIRADESLKDLPVYVLSSDGSQPRQEALQQLHVAGFLQKPFTPEAVRRLVTEGLQ